MIGLTRSDAVFEALFQQIMSGQLRPGDPLAEPEIAKRLGVSRTPVREALDRLADRGLIQFHANRRATVRSLGVEDLDHIFEVREVLEGRAAYRACGRLTPSDFKQLDQLARQVERTAGLRNVEACYRFDEALHRVIAERSGNPILAAEIRELHELVQLGRHMVGTRDEEIRAAFDEHCRIVAALRSGEPATTQDELVRHIQASHRRVVQCLSAELTPAAGGSVQPAMKA